MSLFSTPEENAANPPETWRVVKVADRAWNLETKDGNALSTFRTKRDAEDHRVEGFYFRLWQKERDWYAGKTPPGWRSWEQVQEERERNARRWSR